jgi:hypothetical protein
MKRRRVQKPMLGYHHESSITQTAKNLPKTMQIFLTNDPYESLQYSQDLSDKIKKVLAQLNPPIEFADLRVDDITKLHRSHVRFIDIIIKHLHPLDELLIEPLPSSKFWLSTSKRDIEIGLDDHDDLFDAVVSVLCLTNHEWRYSTLYKGLNEIQQLNLLCKLSAAISNAAEANDLIEFETPVQIFIGGKLINTM